MKRSWLLFVGVFLAAVPSSFGAGLAHSDNFIVMAPDQPLADQILAQAEHFRKMVALAWFGAEVQKGEGAAIVHLELSNSRDLGMFWPIDCPSRRFHRVWMVTSADRAVGSTLHHEIAHVVLATYFSDRLPWWADEGIASQYDDDSRKQTRRQILDGFVQSGKWPSLEAILGGHNFAPDDEAAYAMAVSVTDYLLAKADRYTFLDFVANGPDKGWNTALQEHYGLSSVGELEGRWRAWLHGQSNPHVP